MKILISVVSLFIIGTMISFLFITGFRLINSNQQFTFDEQKLDEIIRQKMEIAYFEGQKDAINGDIRIEKNTDTSWIWIESPWDSGREPIFTNLIDNGR